ncbi:MAG: hypothetical protein ACOZQL_35950 [Myxococcota bacterium]
MKRLMTMLLAVSMVGCAGSVNGSVGGVSLSVADAIFGTVKDNSGKIYAASIFMADKPKLCDSLKANRQPKQMTALQMTIIRTNDTEFLAPDVGEYTVRDNPLTPNALSAGASFVRTDANCTNTLSANATDAKSGLIKVTGFKAETNGNAAGTFDITFGSGDKVTGNFNASYCDLSSLSETPNCE